MKKNNFKIVKIDKNRSLFNYEKKILINELTLELKLGYYDFEKEKPQKVISDLSFFEIKVNLPSYFLLTDCDDVICQ